MSEKIFNIFIVSLIGFFLFDYNFNNELVMVAITTASA